MKVGVSTYTNIINVKRKPSAMLDWVLRATQKQGNSGKKKQPHVNFDQLKLFLSICTWMQLRKFVVDDE